MSFEAQRAGTGRLGVCGAGVLLMAAWGVAACASTPAAVPASPASSDAVVAVPGAEPPQPALPIPADDEPFGSAEGSVVRGGEPLAGCRVRAVLVRLGAPGLADRRLAGSMVEVRSDAAGRFRFARLPVGAYKLKWWLPGETHWIRTLSPDPDFEVKPGETATLRPIEAGRRVVGHP